MAFSTSKGNLQTYSIITVLWFSSALCRGSENGQRNFSSFAPDKAKCTFTFLDLTALNTVLFNVLSSVTPPKQGNSAKVVQT